MKQINKLILIGLATLIVMLTVVVVVQHNELQQTRECKEEAMAWYQATTTQADEFYYWLARGQQSPLDFGVSHIYIAKAHDLNCIRTILPPG
jgi:hypothetical protein